MKTHKRSLPGILTLLALSMGPLCSAEPVTEAPAAVAPARQISVRVTGEVRQPGLVQLPEWATVTDAVKAAGGARDYADTKRIQIIRENGAQHETIKVSLKDIATGKTAATPLKAGDRVHLALMPIEF